MVIGCGIIPSPGSSVLWPHLPIGPSPLPWTIYPFDHMSPLIYLCSLDFLTRPLTTSVFHNNKKLKGRSISVREDLTSHRTKLLQSVLSVHGPRKTWTLDGRINWIGINNKKGRSIWYFDQYLFCQNANLKLFVYCFALKPVCLLNPYYSINSACCKMI